MRRTFLLKALIFGTTTIGLASAEDFVPFLIPAKVNPQSPMLLSGDPISPDKAIDRLVVQNGHFYRGGQRERLWGVNLSFAANWPSQENSRLVAARLGAMTNAKLWIVPADRSDYTYRCAVTDVGHKVDETVTLQKWTDGEIAFYIGYAPQANVLIVRKPEPLKDTNV